MEPPVDGGLMYPAGLPGVLPAHFRNLGEEGVNHQCYIFKL